MTKEKPSRSNSASDNWGLEHIESRRAYIRNTYEKTAAIREQWIIKNRYFYDKLSSFLKFIVEPQKKVVLFRSELGQFFEILAPAKAVGVDICKQMTLLASEKYPQYEFVCDDPESVKLKGEYDYAILYTLGDLTDIEKAFLNINRFTNTKSRLIIINYNYLWRPLVVMAEKLGWKVPQPTQNWLNVDMIENFLNLSGYELVKKYHQILLPIKIPLLSCLINDYIAKIPIIKRLCFIQVLVAKKVVSQNNYEDYSVSVIVPCKNEKGNILGAVERIPEMGKGTEIIFCDDKSTDGTADEVKRVIKKYPDKNIKLVDGPGICKAENVWTGFNAASGDILMILDADLTVIPEELPYFFNALVEGHGEFINGTRMIYPMQDQAMRGLNIVGNKFFSNCFSYILGQRITDTLCGTKVLWRSDWDRVSSLIGSWGVDDRWGDYELLFGAAKLHLKIVEVPVHYVDRVYGETKMTKRFSNGLIMLRMCIAAFRRFKFV